MTAMTIWLVLVAVVATTYLLRVSMFAALGGRNLPAWTSIPMSFVGPAAIAALVASMLFTARGTIDAAPMPEVAAVAAGFVTVRRTGNVVHAFVVGLPVFWVLAFVAG